VDARIWHQVGLELIEINIESTIETQARGDRADDLSNQAVEMFIVWARNVKVATADIVHGLIVNQESTVRIFNSAMGGEDSIVGLDDRGGDTRGRIDGELKLGLLAVVSGQALKEKSTEAGAGASTKRVEDEEALEGRAVVHNGVSANPIQTDEAGSLPATRRMRSMTLSTSSFPIV
jgi:hypothetical protein